MKKFVLKNDFIYILVFAILFCLFLIGTFYDLEISKTIYTGANPFTVFFEAFAWLIGYIFIPIFGLIFYYNKHNIQSYRIILKIVGVIIIIVGIMLTFKSSFNYLGERYSQYNLDNNLVSFGCSLILTPLILIVGKPLAVKYYKQLIGIGFCIIFLFLSYLLLVEGILKPLFARTRFDEMLAGDYSLYTPWYFKGEGGRSFPSGHTATSAVILFIVCLPDFIDKFKIKRIYLFLIALVFMALMALSRVLIGKHFLTDVTFSMILMLSIFILFTSSKFYKRLINRYS